MPGQKVLELGCGCGAITRYLGELGANVTAVEGSMARARIAAERCRDLQNVKVVAEDLLLFSTAEQFDWVLLIGVLEYAPMFSSKSEPVLHYLRSVTSRLAPRGRLVVAIENKLGMKYFNGCGEDHLGVPFSGLQGLYGDRMPRTFGRGELKAQLETVGFSHVEFHYPFPDYKLPQVILSDDALVDPDFNPADMLALIRARDYAGLPDRLFDEALVLREAARNGLLGELSNSFMVIASQHAFKEKDAAQDRTLATSYAVQRNPEFTTQTRFVRKPDAIRVHKEPLHPDLLRRRKMANGSHLEHVPGDADYFPGELAIWKLLAARAKRGDIGQIVAAFEPWFDHLLKRAKERSGHYDGDRMALSHFTLPGDCLDLTPFNLIDAGDRLSPIDQEWRVNSDIPLGWVVTRSVLGSLIAVQGFEAAPINVADVIHTLCEKRGLRVSEEDLRGWLRREATLSSMITGKKPSEFTLEQTSFATKPLLDLGGELKTANATLNQMIVANENEFEDVRMRLAALIEATRQELSTKIKEIEITRNALHVSNARRAALDQELSERATEVRLAQSKLAERTGEFERVRNELDIQRSQLEMVTRQLSYQNEEGNNLRAINEFLTSTILALRTSSSWRVTAPLRLIKYIVQRLRRGRLVYLVMICWRSLTTFSLHPIREWQTIRAIAKSNLFDRDWYAKSYPDVTSAGVDVVRHYVLSGSKEGRDPSSSFSSRTYLEKNPDVATAGANPLAHFIRYGVAERRSLEL